MNRILAALINGGLLSCLVTFMVWLLLRALPRRALNASTRYLVWWTTLAIALLLPLVFLPAPSSRLPAPSPVTLPAPAPPTLLPRAALRQLPFVSRGERVTPIQPQSSRPIFSIELASADWSKWIFSVWGVLSLCLLLRLGLSWILLERTKARACAMPELLTRARSISSRRLRVAGSCEIETPIASGPLRPSILIPAALLEKLDHEAIDQIVVHEAAHLARYDDCALVLQRLLEAILALHPAVRWIARQLDLEREIACDDLVVAVTGQPRRYATCLTRIVELSGGVRPSLAAATAADNTSQLSRRVEMLLDRTRHKGTKLMKSKLTAIVAILCALAWVAGHSPAFIAFAAPLAKTLRQAPARVLAQVPLLPRALEPPPTASNDFAGRVIEDSSGNPLPSAEVRFHKAGMRELAADLDTDRQGQVHAAGLPPGDYTVEVLKPNFITASLKLKIPGEDLTVRLVRYAAIGGRVVDQQGQPVPGILRAPGGRTVGGARVAVLVKAEGSEQLRTVRETTLEEGGVYRIYDLPPGNYALGLWYDGLKNGSGVQLYPDTAHPRFFAVAGGEEYRNIDFLIASGGGFQVTGKVQVPKKGQTYVLALALPAQPALPLAQTLTEPDGSFSFEKVPPGAYDLLVGGPSIGYGAHDSLLGPEPNYGRAQVQVNGANVENLSIAVSPGRSLTVTLHGHGSDALPPGCPQSVSITPELLEPWGILSLNPTPIAFGREQMVNNLVPGRVRLVAGALGAGCYQIDPPAVDLSREQPGGATVELAAAGQIRGTLRPGTARATDFVVVLLESRASTDAQSQLAFPDSQGRFAFEGLRPGKYRLAAQPAAATAKARWVADVTKMIEIDVAGGTPTDIELPIPPKGGK